MSGSTNYTYVTPTGVIVADTSDILSEVQAEWQGVFGPTLNLAQSTPQGLMIAAEALARSNVVKNNAVVSNQINPNQASGLFLDAICSFTGLLRQAATYSTYTGVTIAGIAGTVVPAGSQVTTVNGDYFALQTAVTIGSGGTVTGTYVAVNSGPVAAPSGTLQPFTAVYGLETVTAGSAGSVGAVAQSDVSLRQLRRNTLALQGLGFNEAVTSALNNIPGVLGIQFLENKSASAQTIQTIAMAGSSIWACVDGGTALAIATALYDNTGQGVGWNGAQSYSITDPYSGQVFNVLYDVPTTVAFLTQITVVQKGFAGNATTAVQNAVLAYFTNGISAAANDPEVDIAGIQVGVNVSPFEIAAAIAAICPGIYVREVQISLASTVSYVTTEIAMPINQKATITAGGINVIVQTS
jgi:uncharacterized phage protein gp47/JayE